MLLFVFQKVRATKVKLVPGNDMILLIGVIASPSKNNMRKHNDQNMTRVKRNVGFFKI